MKLKRLTGTEHSRYSDCHDAGKEDILLPTYETGEFEKIRFSLKNGFTKAVAIVVYPYPVEKSPINRLRKVGTSFLSKTNTSKS